MLSKSCFFSKPKHSLVQSFPNTVQLACLFFQGQCLRAVLASRPCLHSGIMKKTAVTNVNRILCVYSEVIPLSLIGLMVQSHENTFLRGKGYSVSSNNSSPAITSGIGILKAIGNNGEGKNYQKISTPPYLLCPYARAQDTDYTLQPIVAYYYNLWQGDDMAGEVRCLGMQHILFCTCHAHTIHNRNRTNGRMENMHFGTRKVRTCTNNLIPHNIYGKVLQHLSSQDSYFRYCPRRIPQTPRWNFYSTTPTGGRKMHTEQVSIEGERILCHSESMLLILKTPAAFQSP